MDFSKLPQGEHVASLDFSKAVTATSAPLDFSKAIERLRIELHWEDDGDGDLSLVLLDKNGQMLAGQIDPDNQFALRGLLFYKNLSLPGIKHSGDVRKPDNDPSSPEETVILTRSGLDPEAAKIAVLVSTHNDEGPAIPLSDLGSPKVLIINDVTNEVLAGAEVNIDSAFTSMKLGTITLGEGFTYQTDEVNIGKQAVSMNDIWGEFA